MKQNKTFNTKSMCHTNSILDFAVNECESTSCYFDNSEKRNNVMFFSLLMLDRLNFSSYSLRILFDEFQRNTKVEYSCGIIIRSVMSDYIILLKAYDILNEAVNANSTEVFDKVNNYCSEMLYDNLRHTINNVSDLYNNNRITPEELSTMYENIISRNPEYFEPYKKANGEKPIVKKEKKKLRANSSDLFQSIKLDELKLQCRNAYEAYIWYSKYDHFGITFYDQQLRNDENSDEMALKNMCQTIELFPRIINYSIGLLRCFDSNNDFLNCQAERIKDFILKKNNNQ